MEPVLTPTSSGQCQLTGNQSCLACSRTDPGNGCRGLLHVPPVPWQCSARMTLPCCPWHPCRLLHTGSCDRWCLLGKSQCKTGEPARHHRCAGPAASPAATQLASPPTSQSQASQTLSQAFLEVLSPAGEGPWKFLNTFFPGCAQQDQAKNQKA